MIYIFICLSPTGLIKFTIWYSITIIFIQKYQKRRRNGLSTQNPKIKSLNYKVREFRLQDFFSLKGKIASGSLLLLGLSTCFIFFQSEPLYEREEKSLEDKRRTNSWKLDSLAKWLREPASRQQTKTLVSTSALFCPVI